MTTHPPASRGRVTALDVAERAGVSRTTVSFVLNDRAAARGISDLTAQRVRQAAEALGYQPDRAALMLRSGTSDLVLFAAPAQDQLGPLWFALVSLLSEGLEEAGLHLVTRRALAGRPLREVWRRYSPAAVMGMELGPGDLADLAAAGTPVLNMDVATFDASVAAAQAEHLLARGHRRLGYAFPVSPRLAAYAQRRLAAVESTCRAAGLAPPVRSDLDLDLASATAAVRTLREDSGVTAVCAYDDDHAFAVLAGMAELGLRAPDDLAVIGMGGSRLSAVAVPPLTTVSQDVGPSADHLLRQLLDVVGGASAQESTVGPSPRVVQRRTT